MAGRGRGVAAFTFNIEALGIGRGSMPEARVGPSPLFPITEFKAAPLKTGEDEDYLLALKQEMRGTMQRLPHNIRATRRTTEVEKYTERYRKQAKMADDDWTPDWNLFPKELMPQKKKSGPKAGAKKKIQISSKDSKEVLNKLDELAKNEDGNKSDDEAEKKAEKEGEEDELEEELDEEEIEEENDYIDSYFDNGEDFGGGSDDNMDGEATY